MSVFAVLAGLSLLLVASGVCALLMGMASRLVQTRNEPRRHKKITQGKVER
jgi:hypothetical protein